MTKVLNRNTTLKLIKLKVKRFRAFNPRYNACLYYFGINKPKIYLKFLITIPKPN